MQQQAKNRDGEMDVSIGPIKRFGRYTLVKKLATGGMAEIWLARHSGVAGFNRFVVIKKILSHLAEEETFRNMFLDEARMSAQLTHPNIVQVYDLGEADQTYFIAMEFIMGENLAAIAWRGVKRTNPLSPAFAARIMADACKALNYAHHLRGSDGNALEIVHRDISPQNILVTYEGEVKVVDFGIAKAASKSQHTKTGMLKGKFSYMSPEQCLGNPVDKRSDVFALGIVLYELCTGKRLFKHESELMILEMITKRRITPPSEVAEGVAPELEQIIMKALEKDAALRFATAQDLQIALEDYIRSASAAATNADIAAYMRALFPDKIEEKRKICELASREDLSEVASFDEEATERAGQQHMARMSTANRTFGTPSQPAVHMMNGAAMRGVPGVGQSFPPGTPVNARLQATNGMVPMANGRPGTQGVYQPALSGMVQGMPFPTGSMSGALPTGAITEERSWLPKIIILLALTVIVVAGTYLYQELTREVIAPPVDPPPPAKMGTIEIDSRPPGATIYVNGNAVKLEDGSTAKTPIAQLTNLVYGGQYAILLKKEGYDTYAIDVTMDDQQNGKHITAELKAIPGTLKVEVAGAQGRDVRVFFNGKDQGLGPMIEALIDRPGAIHVTAELAGHVCTAQPEDIEVKPAETARTSVRCTERGRAAPALVRRDPPADPRPRDTTPRDPRPKVEDKPKPKPAGPDGCVVLDSQPPGYATIDTTPFSEIYFEGRRIGETPLAKYKFPAGCVEILAKTKDGKSKTVRIKVEPNKNLRYKFTL
ncbi:MAG: serine/threonine protein kinase [Deltaproteobacteria bacterium]|nr:serine/threonine protein kinase [Deltaproteobacteria bacterium]